MIIYRVQNPLGEGCYQNQQQERWDEEHSHSNDMRKYPSPYYDEELKANLDAKGLDSYDGKFEAYKFAFESLEQLNMWFTKEELEKLKDIEFEVYAIKIDKRCVILGDAQCVFKYNNIKSEVING